MPKPVGGELLFRPRFLRIPRVATILRCVISEYVGFKFPERPKWAGFPLTFVDARLCPYDQPP